MLKFKSLKFKRFYKMHTVEFSHTNAQDAVKLKGVSTASQVQL